MGVPAEDGRGLPTPDPGGVRFSEVRLDRRRFLILAGGAAAAAATSSLFASRSAKAGGPRTVVPLQPWQLPDVSLTDPVITAKALIAAAILAPSVCNSQPWRFEVQGNAIRLMADGTRALPARDPSRRELMVSLGCALENLLIAARHHGYQPLVTYFPHEGSGGVVAEVRLDPAEPLKDAGLFDAITQRRTNRRNYDGRSIPTAQRALLEAQVGEDSFRVMWLDDEKRLKGFAQLARDAERELLDDARLNKEYLTWLRFSDDDERATGDGESLDALRVGGPSRWMGRRGFGPEGHLRWGASALADQVHDGVKSAAALCLLASKSRNDQQRLIGGQVFERMALKATLLGLAHQPLNVMVQREGYRDDLQRSFGLGPDEDPILLMRLGRAKSVDSTPRRALALVTTLRA